MQLSTGKFIFCIHFLSNTAIFFLVEVVLYYLFPPNAHYAQFNVFVGLFYKINFQLENVDY